MPYFSWATLGFVAIVFAIEGHAQVQLTTQQWHERTKQDRFVPVGQPPAGFAKTIEWNRRLKEATFVIFVNAADPLGVAISNLKKGDEVEVASAVGYASFGEGSGRITSSIVGDTAPMGRGRSWITAGPEFARRAFAWPRRNERRDAFGRDPDLGEWCRDDGGVLICLPSAGGIYHQNDHGIREGEPRWDRHRPGHVTCGFFPLPADIPDAKTHNTRRVTRDGELYVVAWDSEFEDNQGYYTVFLKIRRP